MFISTSHLFSQRLVVNSFSNIDFEQKGDSIIISYNINNTGQNANYYVSILPYISGGKIIKASNFKGDVGLVNSGQHQIIWHYKNDSVNLFKQLLYFELNASVIQQNSFSKSFAKNLLAPGWGSYDYNKNKPYWLYSAIGYTLLSCAISSNYLSSQKYNQYKSETTINGRNNAFKQTQNLSTFSSLCFIGASLTWTFSITDILYKQHKYQNPNYATIEEEKLYTRITGKSPLHPISTVSFSQIALLKGENQALNIIKNNNRSPEIKLLNPILSANGVIQTNSESIIIKSKVTGSAKLSSISIQDESVSLQKDSTISHKIFLEKGINRVSIKATDIASNAIDYSFNIVRTDNMSSDYYALIIGVQDYTDKAFNKLDNPVNDCSALFEVLTNNYNFKRENIILLSNPKKSDLIESFDALVSLIGNSDNLLVFYAGHGIWDSQLEKGYWLPSDAIGGYKGSWFSNTELRDYIAAIKSKQTLLITDACFAGGILKSRGVNTMPQSLQELNNIPGRKAMTSGTLTTVPDKSIFIEYLIKRLKENKENYLSSQALFISLREAVINNSPNKQVPQYGEIYGTGDEGGDFIFIKK